MDTLGIERISSQEQYILFGIYCCKRMYSDENIMKCFYLPTLEMAQDVYITLQYFFSNWNRGLYGGELRSGLRRWDQEKIGEVPYGAIETIIFTKINDEQLLSSQGYMIDILNFVERSKQLMNHRCNLRTKSIPKNFYDEHFLTVLRLVGFSPRIKRTKFIFNPFIDDCIETDENNVRQMGLVLS